MEDLTEEKLKARREAMERETEWIDAETAKRQKEFRDKKKPASAVKAELFPEEESVPDYEIEMKGRQIRPRMDLERTHSRDSVDSDRLPKFLEDDFPEDSPVREQKKWRTKQYIFQWIKEQARLGKFVTNNLIKAELQEAEKRGQAHYSSLTFIKENVTPHLARGKGDHPTPWFPRGWEQVKALDEEIKASTRTAKLELTVNRLSDRLDQVNKENADLRKAMQMLQDQFEELEGYVKRYV